jgi:hypothetical protein
MTFKPWTGRFFGLLFFGRNGTENRVKQSVCNLRQLATWPRNILFVMIDGIKITNVEQDGDDGLIVTFSDGTTSGYVVEELLGLRPMRIPVEVSKSQSLSQVPAIQ